MAEDQTPGLLDGLMSSQQISERIKASAGVTLAPRTIWEKARRIGVAKKIGRSMLIHVDDIPKLLEPETKPDWWPRPGGAIFNKSALLSFQAPLNQTLSPP